MRGKERRYKLREWRKRDSFRTRWGGGREPCRIRERRGHASAEDGRDEVSEKKSRDYRGKETNGVGGSSSSPPSLDRDDRIVLPDDTELETARESVSDTVVNVDLPSLVRSRLGGLVEHGVAASVQVDLARGLLVAGDGDDGARGLELGDEAGSVSRGRHDDDGTGVLLDRGSDGGHGNGLGSGGGADRHRAELVEEGRVADGGFGEEAGLGHHLDWK